MIGLLLKWYSYPALRNLGPGKGKSIFNTKGPLIPWFEQNRKFRKAFRNYYAKGLARALLLFVCRKNIIDINYKITYIQTENLKNRSKRDVGKIGKRSAKILSRVF
jgi:hypothetical protein